MSIVVNRLKLMSLEVMGKRVILLIKYILCWNIIRVAVQVKKTFPFEEKKNQIFINIKKKKRKKKQCKNNRTMTAEMSDE